MTCSDYLMETFLDLSSDSPHEALATLDGGAGHLNMAAGVVRLRKLLGEYVWGMRITKGY
jgi:hypothetical protein